MLKALSLDLPSKLKLRRLKTLDLLFVNNARVYEDSITELLVSRGLKTDNVSYVESDLNPSGVSPLEEIVPGSRDYGIGGDFNSANRYLFSGDELDNDNPLLIVNQLVVYGRVFREVCGVLDEYMDRKILDPKSPPTFAFLKTWRRSDLSVRTRYPTELKNVFGRVVYNPFRGGYTVGNLQMDWE